MSSFSKGSQAEEETTLKEEEGRTTEKGYLIIFYIEEAPHRRQLHRQQGSRYIASDFSNNSNTKEDGEKNENASTKPQSTMHARRPQ